MKPPKAFNSITRDALANIKRQKTKTKINGFDPLTQPQDGFVRYGYTGRGWICWRDGEILGDGWADTDVKWFDRLAAFLNAKHELANEPSFVDLGFGAPRPNSKEFTRWLNSEVREYGYEAAEQRLERMDIIIEVKKSI
jgi:hypothetical protein